MVFFLVTNEFVDGIKLREIGLQCRMLSEAKNCTTCRQLIIGRLSSKLVIGPQLEPEVILEMFISYSQSDSFYSK